MQSYDTISQALAGLKKNGYVEDFNLKEDCLECRNGEYKIFAQDFQVDHFYRFEGDSDPADESIVFAISSSKFNLKGVLVSPYGIYSEPVTDEMVEKLRMKTRL